MGLSGIRGVLLGIRDFHYSSDALARGVVGLMFAARNMRNAVELWRRGNWSVQSGAFALGFETLVVENKCQIHIHAEADDLPIFDLDLLFLDPGALDVADRLSRAFDALGNRVLKTLLRQRRDFNDFGYRHPKLLLIFCCQTPANGRKAGKVPASGCDI